MAVGLGGVSASTSDGLLGRDLFSLQGAAACALLHREGKFADLWPGTLFSS